MKDHATAYEIKYEFWILLEKETNYIVLAFLGYKDIEMIVEDDM